MNYALFYVVILLTNIIQGITGFAGTILAMPFSLRLVGMDVAVPVLNALGLLSGIYVFAGNYRNVNRRELLRVVLIMGAGLIAGIWLKGQLLGKPRLLYCILGALVLFISIKGIYTLLKEKASETAGKRPSKGSEALQIALLAAAGIVHGMFVCGGPLLIGYLTKRLEKKEEFRATISTVWIFLNGFLLISQIVQGQWSLPLLKTQLISIPFLLAGMLAGSILYKHMSQKLFMVITYILLFIAGITLFFK